MRLTGDSSIIASTVPGIDVLLVLVNGYTMTVSQSIQLLCHLHQSPKLPLNFKTSLDGKVFGIGD
jgi:hypothetical protein